MSRIEYAALAGHTVSLAPHLVGQASIRKWILPGNCAEWAMSAGTNARRSTETRLASARRCANLIRESGIPIVDFNFGGHSTLDGYKDEGTRIWYPVAKLIRDSKITLPDRHLETTKKLCAQLTSRRQKLHSSGVLWMESKEEMRARGVKSPDVADAFCIAFAVQSVLAHSYRPFDDSGWRESARMLVG